MGKIGAGVRSVLWVLTCALTVACGSAADGTESADERDVRLTSAEVSPEHAALEAAECASYRDERPLAATTVTIRNDRASPIYLAPASGHEGCQGWASFALEQAGVRLDVRGFDDCEHPSCERLQDPADDRVACLDRCADGAPLTRLEPGASIDVGVFDGEYLEHGFSSFSAPMPARCLAGDEPGADAGVRCMSKRALLPGHYRLSARAFASLECDGQRSCECARTAVGWCMLDRRHRGRGRALEATLELELPAEQATLVFGGH
jgi:hypothetical protein